MRNCAPKIMKMLDIFPAVGLIGPRQAGKTTLCRALKPNWLYVDLENPVDADRIRQDPNFFFQQHPTHIIIDEAQLYPELFQVLRGVIDAQRSQKGRFILTGSSSPELLKHLSESLAGRIATLELSPFKLNEIESKPLSPLYAMFEEPLSKARLHSVIQALKTTTPVSMETISHTLLYGGYPEPTRLQDIFSQKQWINEYVKSYLFRDIGRLFPGLNQNAYRRFLFILAELSGTILNKAELARDLEVSEKTVREYLMIAEGTFLWRNLPSFERNSRKALVKMPKGLLRDSGILCHLSQLLTLDSLAQSRKYGNIFEGFVIEEILRGLSASFATQWQASYYRTRNGAEIDLVLEGGFGLLPIEIKAGLKTDLRHLRVLEEFIQEFECPFGIIVNQSSQIVWLSEGILQLPIGYL